MSGDGVSMTTTLSQMGNVAKSQAQNQNTAASTNQFAEQLGKQDELKVQRVKETQESADAKVKREKDEKDKRKRRRLNRQRKALDTEVDLNEKTDLADENIQEDEIGCLLDLRV